MPLFLSLFLFLWLLWLLSLSLLPFLFIPRYTYDPLVSESARCQWSFLISWVETDKRLARSSIIPLAVSRLFVSSLDAIILFSLHRGISFALALTPLSSFFRASPVFPVFAKMRLSRMSRLSYARANLLSLWIYELWDSDKLISSSRKWRNFNRSVYH